jgi:hypothetical protein
VLWDTAALETERREFVRRSRWLAERGSLYAVLVAPNKETIYPELLPDWLKKHVLLEQEEGRFIQTDRAPRDFEELTTRNDHATTPLRALVFRDSFFSNMIPLVSRHFRHVHYVWGPRFDVGKVMSEQPEVVITQFVERQLATYWPQITKPGDADAQPPATARTSTPPCS